MKKFLKQFRNKYAEEHINLPLANRELEPPLHEFVLDVFASMEKTGYITLVDWELITDESKIEPSRYVTTRKKKGRSQRDKKKYINIKYDRAELLKMYFRCEVKGAVQYKEVQLLLPKYDQNHFMCLKGNQVYLLYQLVNDSTYVTKNSVTLKGMMPLCINRQSADITDTNGVEYHVPTYKILDFQKEFNPLILFSAKVGFYDALEMFACSPVIKVVDIGAKEEEGWTYFIIKNQMTNKKLRDTKIKIKVATKLFQKYVFMKAMVAMAYDVLCSSYRPTIEKIADRNFWLDELGAMYTNDRNTSRDIGKSTLVFWERLIDKTNKKILKMFDYNKRNVYNLTATIIQNFDEFKKKDNNDINSKRLRLNECIGSITSSRMGKSVNRILSKGDKASLDEVVGILKISPNLIFRLLYKSPLITFNDIVNDMDFFNKFKFTVKGPNAIGKQSERKITARDRGVPISSIGKIDVDVCSSSSPGLGGLVSPFAKTYGLHFNGDMESQEAAFDMIKEEEKYIPKDKIHIGVPENYKDYIVLKDDYARELKNAIKINHTSDDDAAYVYIIEDDNW